MRHFTLVVLATTFLLAGGCNKAKDDEGKAGAGRTVTSTANTANGEMAAPPDVAAPPKDALKTEKGVFYKVLTPATGTDKPTVNDTITAHYTGWTTDGKMFDSSVKKERPLTMPLSRMIDGWKDAIPLMAVGQKNRMWVPEALAYKGKPGNPQGMLVFDVELLGFKKAPETPADVAAPPADAKKTAAGVFYKVLKAAEKPGKKPRKWDEVKAHYSGWTTDGKMFDSSITRGEPATFSLARVIKGWQDGLPQMQIGEKFRFWIPEELAYKGKPGRPQGMLVFDVELFGVIEREAPPAVPKDVAAPPKDAKKTKLGVFYKVLKAGKGENPTANSTVEVHYTGWTTDGTMFDSSVSKGAPAKFPLNHVIKGWTDGLQTMKVGGRTLFWIPEELAYKGAPRKPPGMLVFEVELLSFEGNMGMKEAIDIKKKAEEKKSVPAAPPTGK